MTVTIRTTDGQHKVFDAEYIEISGAEVEEIHDGIRVFRGEE